MNAAYESLETPVYVVSEKRIRENCEILRSVKERTGCKILLAQKAFSMFSLYPLIAEYLDGTTASGLYEAKLGKEEMGKENHVFCSAYVEKDFDELVEICDHIVFNSFSQWNKYKSRVANKCVSCGIRINPECSTQNGGPYDPCAQGSRLGVVRDEFQSDLSGIDGLHFHTLCEQNSDALQITLDAVEAKFGDILPKMKWVNFGGGHHITRKDYDIDSLVNSILRFKEKYDVEVYLEPGEAVAYYAGYLVTRVLDVVCNNGVHSALLDASAACHMPDVLEIPYRPPLKDSALANEKAFTYTLAGSTCLAGDIIGTYSFDNKLFENDLLVFEDMAIYSMVKNNTFNGIALPSIAIEQENGKVNVIKKFSYNDFKSRLS